MKQNLVKQIIALCFFMFPGMGKAYIPSYPMILSALALSHGRGMYRIEQTVTFQQSADPLSLQETWWVGGKEGWRLDVRSPHPDFKDLFMRFIYQKSQKIFKDEQGRIKRLPIPLYHIERPFYLRQAQALNHLFFRWRAAPLYKELWPKERAAPWSPETFIQLDRRQGVVNYRISKNSSVLWLEQDEFVIREWQWPDNKGKLQAKDYVTYPGSLFFPAWRRFQWSHSILCIQVQRVQKIPLHKKWFRTRHLARANRLSSRLSPSDQDRIREFYKEYR